MKICRVLQVACLGLCLGPIHAWAFKPFTIEKIKVEGLRSISMGTFLNYLPVHVNDRMTKSNSNTVIQALFDSGFFDNIKIQHQGGTLIFQVTERPVIRQLTIKGNHDISKEDLKKVLTGLGIAESDIYDRSTLEAAKQSLIEQYYSHGKYNARVNVTVTQATDNTVDIAIDISEGRIAEIRHIQIIGNKSFPEKELIKTFKLSTPNIMSFFTHDDQYSKDKLEASLEALRSYYMDRGYIKFEINSAQVLLSPNHKDVFIVVSITENAQYHVKGYTVSGSNVLSKAQLDKLILIQTGDVFSRKKIVDITSDWSNKLGDYGYAYPDISVDPKVDDATKQVFLNFKDNPGQRTYVRNINFFGNTRTKDEVLRREMRQMEGGLISTKRIKESKRNLDLLGYFKNVDMKMVRVPSHPDQVDLNYNVQEQSSSQATFGVGYSDTDGFLINAGITQDNVLGSGKMVGLNFVSSDYERSYRLAYSNPYYTMGGVSRGGDIYYSKTTPQDINLVDYSTNQYGFDINYNLPFSDKNSAQLGFGFQNLSINRGSALTDKVATFLNQEGSEFNHLLLTAGWTYNGTDRAIFPTSGTLQSLGLTGSVPVGGNPLEYYIADYNIHYYQPIYKKSWIWVMQGEAGYGNGYSATKGLPFFENFYAGGLGSVRGYEGNTLGPKDENGNAIGGNTVLTASAGLIFPNPISADSVRTSVFVDAGNVFQLNGAYGLRNTGLQARDIRYSVGLGVEWRSPVGPLVFSIAKPLNLGSHDHQDLFQFTVGAGI